MLPKYVQVGRLDNGVIEVKAAGFWRCAGNQEEAHSWLASNGYVKLEGGRSVCGVYVRVLLRTGTQG